MLVLSRHLGEEILIGDDVVIKVLGIRGDKVRLGVAAPRDLTVHRREIYDAMQGEGGGRREKGEGRREKGDGRDDGRSDAA